MGNQVTATPRLHILSGIHHIGFEVASLEEIAEKMKAANTEPRDDINQALGVGMGGHQGGNVEVSTPDPTALSSTFPKPAGWELEGWTKSSIQVSAISHQRAPAPDG